MLRFLYTLSCMVLALACTPISDQMPEFKHKEKTVLVYMVANNNLSGNAGKNLEAMKSGYIPEDENFIVYYHTDSHNPLLLHLFKDESGMVVQDTVYRFPPRNSAEAASLTSAMKVTATMFPADEYGLFLWSHGTGWLPAGHYTKSFGQEGAQEMDIIDLAKALPYKLSFVAFDACLMGCIEVAYQLKDSVEYVISSPTEVLSDGFPYSKLFKHIFNVKTDPISVAQEYFEYYNSLQGSFRSATISVVKTSELEEVALRTRALFERYRDSIPTLDVSSVQQYFRGDRRWFYDFGDFVVKLAGETDALPVMEALEKAVVYKGATPDFLEIKIDPQRFSGLGTYIPFSPADEQLDAYYKKLEWNKAVEMVK